MKKTASLTNVKRFMSATILLVAFASCQKNDVLNSNAGTTSGATTVSQSVIASASAIAVGTTERTASSSSSARDSIYVIGTCADHHHTDSIPFSSLPSAVSDYLTTTYPGYTFQKAFTDKDTSGTVAGYVVIINYNGQPVGLKFDASGNFVKVLEQREGNDLQGNGWHSGGHFEDRGNPKRDSVALAALPGTVKSYFTTNYSSDTLIRAYSNRDSSIVVVSKNNGLYATLFAADGTFIKRIELTAAQPDADKVTSIDQTALPSVSQTYLSNTYPDYVFKEAFEVNNNGTLEGYIVFITANSTKYAVAFNADGSFIKAVTIR